MYLRSRGIHLGREQEPGESEKAPRRLRDRSLVFDDPFHISVQDREVEGEARWQTIGMAAGLHVLLVAHTLDEETETIHIVSARKATRRERSIYAQSI